MRGSASPMSSTSSAAAALDAARVAVAAETARAYADAASGAERIAVAERTVGLLDKPVTLTSKRLEAGVGTRLDLSRANALRAQHSATLPQPRADRAAAQFPPEIGSTDC